MPSYSMNDLVNSVFGSTFNAQQSHPDTQGDGDARVGRKRKRKADQTIKLIKEFMQEQNRPVTMLEICDYLRRSPGPHLRAFMRQLVETGEVRQTQDYGAGPSIPRFLYELA